MARNHRPTPLLRPSGDRAAREELDHHLAELVDRLVEEGWAPAEARQEAERRFGSPERWRREIARVGATTTNGRWGVRRRVEELVRDGMLALRSARRRPGTTMVLVLTLGVGIGAATAIFSMVDALLLRPLPWEEPDELVQANMVRPGNLVIPVLLTENARTWAAGADFLEETAFWESLSLVRTDGEPETLQVLGASPELDDLLGVSPVLGRFFSDEEARTAAPVALLTHEYWQRTGGDPEVVGSTLYLEGEPLSVVGVLPRGLKFPLSGFHALWVPLAPDATILGRENQTLSVAGRLADGLALPSAQERADALGAALDEERPSRMGWEVRLTALAGDRLDTRSRRALAMLSGAVAMLLLAALANAAGLLAVAGSRRSGEMAVRRALGAGRGRLATQVLTEALVLALAAAALATGLAWAGVEGMEALLPRRILLSMAFDPSLTGRTLLFTALLAGGSGVVVGAVPALGLMRRDAAGALASGGRASPGRRTMRLRNGLVVVEVALSVVLLVGAGLFITSFVRLARVDVGFEPEGLAVLELELGERSFPTPADRRHFVDALGARMAALPGVTSVAAGTGLPPGGGFTAFAQGLQAEGRDPIEGTTLVPYATVDPGYVETLGTRLVHGRAFQDRDRGTRAAILNEAMARDLFGDPAAAPGRRFRLSSTSESWLTVVGVVEALRLSGMEGDVPPFAMLDLAEAEGVQRWQELAVRTEGDPEALLPVLRRTVREMEPTQPIRLLHTGRDAVGASLTQTRFLVTLMVVLAASTLFLAVVGVFGLLSALVSERRRELGVRMALGAGRPTVRRMVLGRGAALSVTGLAIGLGAALLLSRFATSLLYGVEPSDPGTLAGVAALVLVSALAACWIPAVRATRVDPMDALKVE